MTIKDINDIINAVCPNDEDYEKPCISPKYLRQELEQLALDQEQKYLEQEPTTRNCFGCKYAKDNHNAGTEECHLCMWENQYTPTTKNDLGVDCISRADAIQAMQDKAKKLTNEDTINGLCGAVAILFDLPSVTPQEPIHGKCNQCKHYEGVHNVQGHAPCSYHKIGGVMWDWYCSQFESEG